MIKLKYYIGKRWSYIVEDNDAEYPNFIEIENNDKTDTELVKELISAFFDEYNGQDFMTVRCYDKNIIENLS